MRAIIATFKIEILESKSLMLFRPMLAKLLGGKKPKKKMNKQLNKWKTIMILV